MWDALDDLANTAARMMTGDPEWGMKYGGLSQQGFADKFRTRHANYVDKFPSGMDPLTRYRITKENAMKQKAGNFIPSERSPSPYIMISTPPVPREPLLLMPSKAQRAAMYRQSPKSYRTSPYKFRPRK